MSGNPYLPPHGQSHAGVASRGGKARRWSWVLGAASVLIPFALYSHQAWRFSQWAEQRHPENDYVCGMPLVVALLLSALVGGALALAAFAIAITGYFRLAGPRPTSRLLEAFLVGLIFFLLVVLCALFDF